MAGETKQSSGELLAPGQVPNAPPLTDAQADAAASTMIFNFPTIFRQWIDPPIPGQLFTVYCIMPLKEPKILKNGKKIYAYVKSRGNYPDEASASAAAKRLLKEVDSRFPIRIGRVGVFHPVSDDPTLALDLTHVNTDGADGGGEFKDKHLGSEASKDKEAEDRRIMRELRENEDHLRADGDVYDDPDHVRFYAMKRNTEQYLTDNIKSLRRQLKKAEDTRTKVWRDLRMIENAHPEHIRIEANGYAAWLNHLNAEKRAPVGLPDFIPATNQYEEYEAYHPTDLPEFDAAAMRGYSLAEQPETVQDRLIRRRREGKVVAAGGGGAADGRGGMS